MLFITCTSKKWSNQTHALAIKLMILRVNVMTSVRMSSFK